MEVVDISTALWVRLPPIAGDGLRELPPPSLLPSAVFNRLGVCSVLLTGFTEDARSRTQDCPPDAASFESPLLAGRLFPPFLFLPYSVPAVKVLPIPASPVDIKSHKVWCDDSSVEELTFSDVYLQDFEAHLTGK